MNDPQSGVPDWFGEIDSLQKNMSWATNGSSLFGKPGNDMMYGLREVEKLYAQKAISSSEYQSVMAHASDGAAVFFKSLSDVYFNRAANMLNDVGSSPIVRNAAITATYAAIADKDPFAVWFAPATLASAKVGEGILETSVGAGMAPWIRAVNDGLAFGNQAVFKDMVPVYEMYRDMGIQGLKIIQGYDQGRILSNNLQGYVLQDQLETRARVLAAQMHLPISDSRVMQSLLQNSDNLVLYHKAAYQLVYHEQKELLQRMYDTRYDYDPGHTVGYEMTQHHWANLFGPSQSLQVGLDLISLGSRDLRSLTDRLSFVNEVVTDFGKYYSRPFGYDFLAMQRSEVEMNPIEMVEYANTQRAQRSSNLSL